MNVRALLTARIEAALAEVLGEPAPAVVFRHHFGHAPLRALQRGNPCRLDEGGGAGDDVLLDLEDLFAQRGRGSEVA